jgi:diketogulonate reductase-like aldo/keto reductase
MAKPSSIIFGTRHFHPNLRPEATQALSTALEQGVTSIDFAKDFADGKVIEALRTSIPGRFRENIRWVYRTSPQTWVSPEHASAEIKEIQSQLPWGAEWTVLIRLPAHPERLEEGFPLFSKTLVEFQKLKEEGRIHALGVSSDGFSHSKESPSFASLERCIDAHPTPVLDWVSAPLNLLEAGAAFADGTTQGSVVDFCRKNKMNFLAYRPLNAWGGSHWIRLAPFPNRGEPTAIAREWQETLKTFEDLENQQTQSKTPGLAHLIRHWALPHLDPLHWSSILSREAPRLLEEAEKNGFSADYFLQAEKTLLQGTMLLESLGFQNAVEILNELHQASAHLKKTASLSLASLALVQSIPGVTHLSVGMTRPIHVTEALQSSQLGIPVLDSHRAFQFAHHWSEIEA